MSNEIVLQLHPSPANGRNSEATFVALQGGRILIAWSKFTGSDNTDFGAGVIAARWSDHEGRTWSHDDRVLVENEGSTNVMSPSLLRLHDGRIALLYLRKDGLDQCIPYIRFSSDEAATFSAPVRVIPVAGYHCVNNDRLVQLRSGRLIMAVASCRWRGPALRPVEELLAGDDSERPDYDGQPCLASPALINFYFSDDGGATWYESVGSYYRCFPDGTGVDEPGLVELVDGRLWSYSRSGPLGLPGVGGRQWQSFSTDEGNTWQEPEPSQFVSPCSPMQVKRIPSTGDLLAVWNDQSGRFQVPPPLPISWGRTPLACAVSRDEGATWAHHKLLEDAPDHGFCYPALHFAADAVLISYNAGGATSRNPLDTQRVRRITLDEIYA